MDAHEGEQIIAEKVGNNKNARRTLTPWTGRGDLLRHAASGAGHDATDARAACRASAAPALSSVNVS